MKIFKTASGNKVKISQREWRSIGRTAGWLSKIARWGDDEWEYKGHRIEVWPDYEEDNIKLFHDVWLPSGERVMAPISPYEDSREAVNLWIDLDYPKSKMGSWSLEALQKLKADRDAEFAGPEIPDPVKPPDLDKDDFSLAQSKNVTK